MGSIRIAGQLAIKVMEHLGYEPELCARQASPRSTCRLCADVCPVNALSIERSMTPGQMVEMDLDEDVCIQCGLCTVVCPTSAFVWNNPTLMQLRSKLAKLASTRSDRIYLTCDRTKISELSDTILSVPCLGLLPWEFWLSVLSDFPKSTIFLPEGLCGHCQITRGEELLIDQISQAEEILGTPCNLCTDLKELDFMTIKEREGYDPSRRGFFTDLAEASKRVAGIAVETAVGKDPAQHIRNAAERYKEQRVHMKRVSGEDLLEDDKDVAGESVGTHALITGRRKLLVETLKRHPDLCESTPVVVPLANTRCTDCKACAYLCPTEAITLGPDGIMLSPTYCVACKLCSDICWPGALHFVTKNGNILQSDKPVSLRHQGVSGTYSLTGAPTTTDHMGDLEQLEKQMNDRILAAEQLAQQDDHDAAGS